MEYKDLFIYCPKCKSKLPPPKGKHFRCNECDFSLYMNPSPCNAAIILDEKKRIMLVKRKYDPKKDYWDFPGGFIENDESVEDSLRRELREELGIEIKNMKYIASYTDRYIFDEINYHTLGCVFAAEIAGGEMKPNDDIDEIKFFESSEIPFDRIAFDSVKAAIKAYLR